MFEYVVEELRGGMARGAAAATALQGLLNGKAEEGWQFKSTIDLDSRGRPEIPTESRHGPSGGTLLVIFERQAEG